MQSNKQLSTIEQGLQSFAGTLPTSERVRQANQNNLNDSITRESVSADEYARIAARAMSRGQNKNRVPLRHKVGAALATTVALASPAGEPVLDAVRSVPAVIHELATNDNDTIDPVAPGSPDAAVYNPTEGETATDIAVKVDAAIDGVANNQNVEALRNDISEQAGEDGVHANDEIYLPAAADTNPATPEIELTQE